MALEPSTGKILAMVSNPTYDPNLHRHPRPRGEPGATTSGSSRTRASRCSTAAIQEIYPPGSTFKLVTAAAALESGDYDPDTLGARAASIRLPGTEHRPAQRQRRQLRRPTRSR